jgi:hypothetical protein
VPPGVLEHHLVVMQMDARSTLDEFRTTMKIDAQTLLEKHDNLIHSEYKKVNSHIQRADDGWIINTVMIEGCETPFRFKRKKQYRNLQGNHVNLTYYPNREKVGGTELEVMKVVRIRIA